VPTSVIQSGFVGQLYDVTNLVLVAAPGVVVPGSTSQLTGIAQLDDGTVLALGGAEIAWNATAAPLVSINGSGLATAGPATPTQLALFSGSYAGRAGNGSLIVNTPPVVTNSVAATDMNTAIALSGTRLLRNAGDAEGNALLITGASAVNGTAVWSGGILTFTPAPGYYGTAQVDYLVSDPYSTSTGSVLVTVRVGNTTGGNQLSISSGPPGHVTVTFAGIPNRYYVVQSTTNLALPVPPNWVNVATNQAGPAGVWFFTNAVGPEPQMYYRTTGGTVSPP
jgi:hypothetical protein